MKYLNLGCGVHYSRSGEWVNIDFSSREGVIGHNLLKGIPCESGSFDLVYHSHVLEHFSREDAAKFIEECFRVLKTGGVLRVVIPDLENIVKMYLECLNTCLRNPEDKTARSNYDWMLIEMYDQTVRNQSGGGMVEFLHQDKIINEDFVFSRIGKEGRSIRKKFLDRSIKKGDSYVFKPSPLFIRLLDYRTYVRKIKNMFLKDEFRTMVENRRFMEIGKFRLGGEIHQWMYDRYSLSRLLEVKGGGNIKSMDAFTSYISNWASYGLDGKENIVRKPDSLFVEAIKK